MKRIYLAGFDVFRADAKAHGNLLKQICQRYGFEGCYPLDHECPAGLSPQQAAQWIYDANVALIRRADLLVANLNNFRGYEPDSGTCFEVGFAAALGMPVWGYFSGAASLIEQVPQQRTAEGICFDAQGFQVEDFGLPRNLMLSCSAQIVHGELEDCLIRIVAGAAPVPMPIRQ